MKLFSSILGSLSQRRLIQSGRDLKLRLIPPASYSQHGEDLFVSDMVLSGSSDAGTYVDIGASHPARLSNTYYFYRKGWRGLVVEPIDALMALHRRWRPDDIHAQCLIGDCDCEAEFFQIYPSVLSTTSRAEMERRLREGSILLRTSRLRQLQLQSLLERHLPGRSIDFMSVDVEGVDEIVARQIVTLPRASRPKILCIESNSPETTQMLDALLGPVYRRRHNLGCNLIFWDRQ